MSRSSVFAHMVLTALLIGTWALVPMEGSALDETSPVQTIIQQTSIQKGSVEVTVSQIRELVEGYLRDHMRWDASQARIVDVQVAHPVVLPVGRITATIKERRGNDAFPGRVPLSIAFQSDGAHEQSTWAIVRIEVIGEAVFAKQSIKRRRPITAEDVELRKVDLGACPSHVLVNIDEVIGSRATRAIGEGTMLTSDMVLVPPAIQKRAVVAVIAERGGLKLKTLGEVKEDGRIGDLVRVMNLQSKKVIYARVVDSETVRVEF